MSQASDVDAFLDPGGHTLTGSDGFDHQRLRRLVSPWFSPKRIEQLRERVRVTADAVLAKVEPGTDFDVMAELADIIPSRLFCWMMGVPDSDAPALARLSKVLLTGHSRVTATIWPAC